jgi:hypothetical protein
VFFLELDVSRAVVAVAFSCHRQGSVMSGFEIDWRVMTRIKYEPSELEELCR